MTLKFQYNKTAAQQIKKQLAIRENALPTLIAKEAALRIEVKKAQAELQQCHEKLLAHQKQISGFYRLFSEFPENLIRIDTVEIEQKKIAGVTIPLLKNIQFKISDSFSLFHAPGWIVDGLQLLKDQAEIGIRRAVAQKKVDILQLARRKTTQKVNLYEKVQIPQYRNAVLRIKRFLEDVDILEKSSQKILKQRLSQQESVS